MAQRDRAALFGLPLSGLAALPACPACYPAYAGILSSLGLTGLVNPSAQAWLTALFLIGALAALAWRATARRGLAPLALGALGAGVVVGGKYALGADALTYVGVALLVGAGIWNVWPRRALPLLEKTSNRLWIDR